MPRGLYLSKALELDAVSSLGEIRFFGFKDRDAKLRIRTRSGSDEDPERYWRLTGRGDEKSFLKANGQPLTLSDYNSLQGGKGGITTDLDNWSFWSGPYDLADSLGAPITSPSPRQFFQLQLEFLPQGLDGAGVDFVEFHITLAAGGWTRDRRSLAHRGGTGTRDSLSSMPCCRPFPGARAGLTGSRWRRPDSSPSVDSVRINEERLEDGEWDLLAPLADQRLVLSLPRIDRTKSGSLVEVFFQGRAFRFGTVFSGQVFDGQRPLEVGQFVEDGDATFRLDSNQRSVGIELNDNIVSKVAANPRVMTPNDDGINDQVRIEYTLLELAGVGEVQVSIFDLAGRQVRQDLPRREQQRPTRATMGRSGRRRSSSGTGDISVSGASGHGCGTGRAQWSGCGSFLGPLPHSTFLLFCADLLPAIHSLFCSRLSLAGHAKVKPVRNLS